MDGLPSTRACAASLAAIALLLALGLAVSGGAFVALADGGGMAPAQTADLSVDVGQATGGPGQTVVVPVSIDATAGQERSILGYDIHVGFDETVLEFVEARDAGFAEPVANAADGTVSVNAIVAEGEPTPLQPVELVFRITGDAGAASSLTVDADASALSVEDGSPTVQWNDGSVEVRGDGPTPTFAISDLQPGDVSAGPGESIEVGATVANGGDVDGSASVDLMLDGEVIDTTTVSVPTGETRDVEFTLEAPDEPGEHTYAVRAGSDGVEATLQVEDPYDGVTVQDQAVGSLEDGQEAVLVQGLDAEEGAAVVLTYGDEDRVAGVAELTAEASSRLAVPVDDDAGVPGPHDAVVVQDATPVEVGEPLPTDAGELSRASGTLLEATIQLEDQALGGTSRPIEVAQAHVDDGSGSPGYVVMLETADGAHLATSESFSGAIEGERVALETALSGTSQEVVASLGVATDDTTTVRALDDDRLAPVTSTATVTVEARTQEVEVEIGSVPDAVTAGDAVDVPVTVENVGEERVDAVLTLEAGGELAAEAAIDLDPGASTTATLAWTPDGDDVGSVDLTVAIGDRTDQVAVSVEAGGTPTETPEGTTATETEGSDDQPGFGLVAAVIAVALLVGAGRRRRS